MKKRRLGHTNDLTSQFMSVRQKFNAPPEDPKNRFLVKKGVLQGIKPSNSPKLDDRALLPVSTKASSSDDSTELKTIATLISASHLPPVYVDLQEEIEQNLQEIATLSMLRSTNISFSFRLKTHALKKNKRKLL